MAFIISLGCDFRARDRAGVTNYLAAAKYLLSGRASEPFSRILLDVPSRAWLLRPYGALQTTTQDLIDKTVSSRRAGRFGSLKTRTFPSPSASSPHLRGEGGKRPDAERSGDTVFLCQAIWFKYSRSTGDHRAVGTTAPPATGEKIGARTNGRRCLAIL